MQHTSHEKPSRWTSPQRAVQRYAATELEGFHQLLMERLAVTDASIASMEQGLLLDRGNRTGDMAQTCPL